MVISHKYKFIFIHVPKTGGVSMSRYLLSYDEFSYDGYGSSPAASPRWPPLDSGSGDVVHMGLSEMLSSRFPPEAPERGKDFLKFAFVRNPWDRLVSRYFYGLGRGRWGRPFGCAPGVGDKDDLSETCKSFSYYIENLDSEPWKAFSTPQCELVDGCDFIGRFENLQEDFNTICNKIDFPATASFELKHKNKSNHTPYRECYDDKTREIVAEKCRKDIETFGYEF